MAIRERQSRSSILESGPGLHGAALLLPPKTVMFWSPCGVQRQCGTAGSGDSRSLMGCRSEMTSLFTRWRLSRRPARHTALGLLVLLAMGAAGVWGVAGVGMLRGGSSQFQASGSVYERANALYRRVTGQSASFGVLVLLERGGAGGVAGDVAAGRVRSVLVEQRGFDRLVDAIPSRPGGQREVLLMAAFTAPVDSVAAVARLQRLIGRGGVRLGGWGELSGGPDIAFHELDALTSRMSRMLRYGRSRC